MNPTPEPDPPTDEPVLEKAVLELPYLPDFLLDEVRFWFVPSRGQVHQVYHELVGESAKNWSSYYTNKGWKFLQNSQHPGDGPYRVRSGAIRLEILEQGWFLAPRPVFYFEPGGPGYPIVSLEKRRPINPWKPNYIRALNFIKKYEWPRSLPRRVQVAIWEIEECGQIPGSISWKNAEAVLRESDSEDLRYTLSDLFFNRPEDFPLGSEVYLRVLAGLGEDGFARLKKLASHPVTRKRGCVAKTLGSLLDPRAVEPLLVLLEDEDSSVRSAALRSLANNGVTSQSDPEGKVRSYLESEESELPQRVWAAAALLRGGEEEHRKFLIGLVKDEQRPLDDMGELGEVLAALKLIDATPFLIQRLKSGSRDLAIDAADALGRLTGLNLEYSAEEDAEQKRLAVRAYNRWWEEKKRERSAQRQAARKK